MPLWRNWQTRWTQNPVLAREYGFDPHRRHLTRYGQIAYLIIICRCGGIGRRAGLKIQFSQGSMGSTPIDGILILDRFIYGFVEFFCCIKKDVSQIHFTNVSLMIGSSYAACFKHFVLMVTKPKRFEFLFPKKTNHDYRVRHDNDHPVDVWS